jgi:hypothetical protein
MNLITSLVSFVVLLATTHVQGKTLKYVYKENSLLISSEASFPSEEACLEYSYVTVFAGNSVYKQEGNKKFKTEIADVQGTLFSDCTKKGATKSELYLFDYYPKLVFDGLESATVSISTTAYVQQSSCTVNTYVDLEFDYNYTYYSCCEGESFNVPVTLDLSVETYGKTYKERSNGIRKGPGFVTEYQSNSKCKEQQKSTFSNFVVDGVSFTVDEAYNFGDICKAKEGSSSRYSF